MKTFLPLEEAFKIIHPLKFSSINKFQKWRQYNHIDNIPSDVPKHYHVTWEDFLDYPIYKISILLSYEEAIKIVHPYEFKSEKEYSEWRLYNNITNLPPQASLFYNVSWSEFLGNGRGKKDKFISFEEAIKIIHPLKFKSEKEFKVWRKNNKITSIPSNPYIYYNKGWPDLLGTRKYMK
jgi:rRNA maturation protein Nop10